MKMTETRLRRLNEAYEDALDALIVESVTRPTTLWALGGGHGKVAAACAARGLDAGDTAAVAEALEAWLEIDPA